ncbi:hypothetical protein [Lentzea albidocapillata]|uniref:hypothetical protein n=1 Tax=Lentzea albidocapillata TaxID=40571 RepID=UPI0011824989|nr:hypothetical protein [Lentzea albidocapillata]
MQPARCIAFIGVVTVFSLQLTTPALASAGCSPTVDERSFATAPELRALNATVAGFGVRATGSPSHNRLISWLERRVDRLPGVSVRSEPFAIQRWQPGPGLLFSGGVVPVAAAIPYSAPGLRSGELVRLPAGTPITAANAGGRSSCATSPPSAAATSPNRCWTRTWSTRARPAPPGSSSPSRSRTSR